MTDERNELTDDEWIDALEGKAKGPGDDARIIRAALEAQDELTSERISDEDLEAAKQRLLARLRSGEVSSGESAGADSGDSNVVELSARGAASARPAWWQQNPGILLAASVAFVAVLIMVLKNPDVPDSPALIMSYGEVDTVRGGDRETIFAVDDPDAFGRELGATLTEREIPFTLLTDGPDSPDRIVRIQIDGVENAAGVRDTLAELGLAEPETSVVIVRLVPQPPPDEEAKIKK